MARETMMVQLRPAAAAGWRSLSPRCMVPGSHRPPLLAAFLSRPVLWGNQRQGVARAAAAAAECSEVRGGALAAAPGRHLRSAPLGRAEKARTAEDGPARIGGAS